MHKLAAIIGPTAIGKSDVALKVAPLLKAEILSCDSMQVYKGMNIGTAKVTIEEQKLVKHHLIDIVTPDQDYSVADYQAEAKIIISNLNGNNIIPLLVGGTGLYYQAVVDDYVFFPMETKNAVRKKWNEIINVKGLDYAYNYLGKIDSQYAAMISSNDQKRIVRAIEVYELTKEPFSALQNKNINSYNLVPIGLHLERQELYSRINTRVLHMLDNGLIEEVISLRNNGYDLNFSSMQSLGYLQVCYYLDGFLTKEQMIHEIQRETRHYAKRQYTWFNKDKRIKWFDMAKHKNSDELVKNISTYFKGQFYVM